jgi:hypothetical protein
MEWSTIESLVLDKLNKNNEVKPKTKIVQNVHKNISSNIVDKVFTAEESRLNKDIYKRRISNPNPLHFQHRRLSKILYNMNNNSIKIKPLQRISEKVKINSDKSHKSLYKFSNKHITPSIKESDNFVQVSKKKVDDTFLNKENKNIKNFLNSVITAQANRDTIKQLVKRASRSSLQIYDSKEEVQTNPFVKTNSLKGNENLKRTATVPCKPPLRLHEYPFKSRTHKENEILYYTVNNHTMSREATIDLDIENIDFPLHNEKLQYSNHYLEKFSYKLYRPYRELVTMRNIYDSLSDDELQENTYWYTINPLGNWKILWNCVAIIFAIYNITVYPYDLAFNETNNKLFDVHICLDIFFIIDWVMDFFTGFFEEDIIIYDIHRIAYNHITSWQCYVNIISSIPYDGLLTLILPNYLNYKFAIYVQRYKGLLTIFTIFEYLKWIKLFRVVNLKHKCEILSLTLKSYIHINLYLRTMISYFTVFAILIYMTTCFWCYLGYNFIYSGDTWVTQFGFRDSSHLDIFIVSLYYVFYTMFTIGYGDITPYTFKERIFASLLMTLGSLIWSFLLTACSQFFVYNVEKKIILRTKLGVMERFTKDYNLNEGIVDRIRKCIFYSNRTTKTDHFELMNYLPVFLKNELYLSMYKRQVAHLRFFTGQSYNFIITVLPLLMNVQLLQGEFVKNKGEIVKNLDMVIKGVLSINVCFNRDILEIGEVKSSYHIGDILMYMEDQCPYDIIVKTKVCNMFILSKTHFAELKMSFKETISGILIASHAEYCVIENRRIQATDYYNEFRTFKGLNLNKATQYVLTTESSVGARNRMSHISSQIVNDIFFDDFMSKNRPAMLIKPDISSLVQLEEAKQSKKYFSSAESSSDLELDNKFLATIHEVNKDSFGSEKETCKLSSKLNVKDLAPKIVKKSIASIVQKNEVPKLRYNRSFTLCNLNQPSILKSFSKKNSIDITNKMNFMNIINNKIENDVVLNRNPELVQDHLFDLILQRNHKIIKKQVKRVHKILYRLNKILVLNLRTRTIV